MSTRQGYRMEAQKGPVQTFHAGVAFVCQEKIAVWGDDLITTETWREDNWEQEAEIKLHEYERHKQIRFIRYLGGN